MSIIFINNNNLIILLIMMPFSTLVRSSYRPTPGTTLSISPLPGPFHMLFLGRLDLLHFDRGPNGFAIVYHPLLNTNIVILNRPLQWFPLAFPEPIWIIASLCNPVGFSVPYSCFRIEFLTLPPSPFPLYRVQLTV
jgi:hypothetical protein